jgi:hypothetical protein
VQNLIAMFSQGAGGSQMASAPQGDAGQQAAG